jgi:hypothetical protein
MSLVIPAHAADPPLVGKWSSEAAVALKKWRTARDNATPPDRGLFSVDQGLRGGRGGVIGGQRGGPRGGGGIGGGGIGGGGIGGGGFGGGGLGGGGFGGRDFAQAGRGIGGAPLGGGFGGGQLGGPRGGQLGGGQLGAPLGGGARGRGIGPVTNIPPLNLPDGPPISMEFKVDKKNVLTGQVVVSIDEEDDDKFKIEEGKVDGKAFKFLTRKKVNGISIATGWQGEMTTDNTIRALRLLPSGAPADEEPFALHRQK